MHGVPMCMTHTCTRLQLDKLYICYGLKTAKPSTKLPGQSSTLEAEAEAVARGVPAGGSAFGGQMSRSGALEEATAQQTGKGVGGDRVGWGDGTRALMCLSPHKRVGRQLSETRVTFSCVCVCVCV